MLLLLSVTLSCLPVTASEADITPPTIYGVKDLTVVVGGSVSYKRGVFAEDDTDPSVTVQVDSGKVNLHKAGQYPVTYTATDQAGNATSKTVTVTVVQPDTSKITHAAVQQLAKDALAEMGLTDETMQAMPEEDRARTIYNWIQDNFRFCQFSGENSWLEASYFGLTNRKGDCYNYAGAAKSLMEAAGIECRLISNPKTNPRHHCWNIVKIEGTWHHFDVSPQRGKAPMYFFLISDKDLASYSASHDNYYEYDRTLYPEIE